MKTIYLYQTCESGFMFNYVKYIGKLILLLGILNFLMGCNSIERVNPPEYNGKVQEITPYETKGLSFVETVVFRGALADARLQMYANEKHYRYYVILFPIKNINDFDEKLRVRFYR